MVAVSGKGRLGWGGEEVCVEGGGTRGRVFFNDTATTEIYTGEDTLSLHDALP
eukprot:COSAG05_NODE_22730_length_263_cov_0.182927_1_plen_52_part_01